MNGRGGFSSTGLPTLALTALTLPGGRTLGCATALHSLRLQQTANTLLTARAMNDRHRKPWWEHKCWIVALVLWLVVAYLLSVGPVIYADVRGWVPSSLSGVLRATYGPLDRFVMSDVPGSGPLSRYALWHSRLAVRHSASHYAVSNGRNHSGKKDTTRSNWFLLCAIQTLGVAS